MAQGVKNPPAMQETQEMRVRSVSWKDPLEEGVETHSSVLAWEIPWTEEPGGLPPRGLQSQTRLSTRFLIETLEPKTLGLTSGSFSCS